MMYYLHHLSGQFIGFNVFLYVTFRAIAAAVTAFLTTLIFGNFIIEKLRALKVEQPIRGAAEVHRLAELQGVKQGTPTMGGVLVIGAVVVSSILWARLDNKFVWLALFSILQFSCGGILAVPLLSVRGGTDHCLFGAYRRGAGLSLVQLLSGQGFHGRHRIAGHWRHPRRCRDLL